MKTPHFFSISACFILVLALLVPACASQSQKVALQPWEAELNDLKIRQGEMNAQIDGLQQKVMVLEGRLASEHQTASATEARTPVVHLEPDNESEPVVISLHGDEG